MPKKFGNGIDLQNTKAINVADPTNPGDAVNLQYLTNFIQGMRFKPPVRAASVGNVTLSAPGASLDGVALRNGDRILLKNQTNHVEDGIYVWAGASTALVRAVDADSAGELESAVVVVAEGTATDPTRDGALLNADRAWLQRVDGVVIGTTAQAWIPLPGASTLYSPGNGLTLNGVQFSVVAVAGGGLSVVAGGVQVDATIVSRHTEKPVGDGTSTTITIRHGLGRRPLPVTLMNVATGALEDTDVAFPDDDNVTLTWAAAPATNAYRASIG